MRKQQLTCIPCMALRGIMHWSRSLLFCFLRVAQNSHALFLSHCRAKLQQHIPGGNSQIPARSDLISRLGLLAPFLPPDAQLGLPARQEVVRDPTSSAIMSHHGL